MFNSPFEYKKTNSQQRKFDSHNFRVHNYSFKGKSNKRYLVIVEEFDFVVHAVKFCLAEHKVYDDRFSRNTNLHECSRVIATVGLIMTNIFEEMPYASFVLIGANSKGESKTNTKRFRVYSKIVANTISPIHFEHKDSVKHSAYMLINRNQQEPDLQSKIEKFLDLVL